MKMGPKIMNSNNNEEKDLGQKLLPRAIWNAFTHNLLSGAPSSRTNYDVIIKVTCAML